MMKQRRKSGNGTSRRQWLYLYVNIPMLLLVKVGISGNYKRRARQVGKTTFGWIMPIFAVKVPFAWQLEQAMHRWFWPLNFPYGGSKEWFLLPVVPVAMAIMLLALLLEWALLAFAVILGLLWLWH